MHTSCAGLYTLASVLVAAVSASSPHTQQTASPDLGGTSWRLVRFQGSDDTTRTPDDPAKYTIQFNADGSLTARVDCNRGRGTWKSAGPSQLQLGPMALTRAMCPPGSLHDQIVKHWSFIRSYVIKDGHLFLSLMADGGIYEFEPIAESKTAQTTSPVHSTGPITYDCTLKSGGTDALIATFYQTEPGLVLVERAGATRPAFRVLAASGAKYEGQDLMFWEARGEATVIWSGGELTCKKR